jgi:hypothetical protein
LRDLVDDCDLGEAEDAREASSEGDGAWSESLDGNGGMYAGSTSELEPTLCTVALCDLHDGDGDLEREPWNG